MSMNVNHPVAGARQFVADPPFWGSKTASRTGPAWQKNPGASYGIWVAAILGFTFVGSALVGGLYLLVPRDFLAIVGPIVIPVLAVVFIACVGGWYWYSRSGSKKIVISVANHSLTVNTRPGDVYLFSTAKLGTWGQTGGMTMGTALHLQCGPHRFVLGGRDRRVPAGTRLDAPDVGYGLEMDIDAQLPAAEFEEVLALVGGSRPVSARSALDKPSQAPSGLTRCLLFTNPLLAQEFGAFQYRQRNEFMQSVSRPRLAIDVGPEAIWVVDPNTNTVIASAWPAQVSATPVVFQPRLPFGLFLFGGIASYAVSRFYSTAIGMHVQIPGMQPLTFSCRDSVSGLDKRFSWQGNAPTARERADYEVMGTDWLTLVEKFGLTQYLKTRG
ncbi:hypothetical protein [Mycolicibacterium arenosum]|uniref:DUF3137 domain-containing protein n=1 Tax=Mycolicibacterium arenosum TaxID=2952157 RepID=A0ABT1LZ25_9MYCO|nr:hypothetical protein [Mycolicibacterium sp. CAU 1645]MCP9272148.1 hypothetical protein [Mycolicibacterium sp. CAU 1645]